MGGEKRGVVNFGRVNPYLLLVGPSLIFCPAWYSLSE